MVPWAEYWPLVHSQLLTLLSSILKPWSISKACHNRHKSCLVMCREQPWSTGTYWIFLPCFVCRTSTAAIPFTAAITFILFTSSAWNNRGRWIKNWNLKRNQTSTAVVKTIYPQNISVLRNHYCKGLETHEIGRQLHRKTGLSLRSHSSNRSAPKHPDTRSLLIYKTERLCLQSSAISLIGAFSLASCQDQTVEYQHPIYILTDGFCKCLLFNAIYKWSLHQDHNREKAGS